jgi:paraquat-inducible protein B
VKPENLRPSAQRPRTQVSGLGPGSPVTFQGLRIGEVTSVNLEYDPKSDSIRAPVRFQLEPEHIADMHQAAARGNARMLVERGMRAQLQSSNLITGQMQVALVWGVFSRHSHDTSPASKTRRCCNPMSRAVPSC